MTIMTMINFYFNRTDVQLTTHRVHNSKCELCVFEWWMEICKMKLPIVSSVLYSVWIGVTNEHVKYFFSFSLLFPVAHSGCVEKLQAQSHYTGKLFDMRPSKMLLRSHGIQAIPPHQTVQCILVSPEWKQRPTWRMRVCFKAHTITIIRAFCD